MSHVFEKMFSAEVETRCRAQAVERPSPTTPATTGTSFTERKENRLAVHSQTSMFPALLWTANLVLITVAPGVLVYGTVLPVLAETLPFLAKKVPVPVDITVLLQLLLVGWLLMRTCQFYSPQVALYLNQRQGVWSFFRKWCSECAAEVAHHASHCNLCGECVEKRHFHSLLLNACVGHGDDHETMHLLLLDSWSKDCLGMFLILVLETCLGGPLRLSYLLFFMLAAFAAEQHAQELREQQAEQWRRPGDSLHLHAE